MKIVCLFIGGLFLASCTTSPSKPTEQVFRERVNSNLNHTLNEWVDQGHVRDSTVETGVKSTVLGTVNNEVFNDPNKFWHGKSLKNQAERKSINSLRKGINQAISNMLEGN